MFRAVLYMAALGALLRVAKSDFECFADKFRQLDDKLQSFFGENREKNCQSGQKDYIDSLQRAIDECSVPVKTDSMKSLIEELCQPDSELYKTFEEKGTCMYLNSGLGAFCREQHKLNPSSATKQACLKSKQDIFTCTAESTGGPCGERAVKALKHVFKTTDSLTNGLCEEVASSTFWSRFARYLHWVAIAVSVLTAVIVYFLRRKKRALNREIDQKVLINETV